MDNFLSLYDCHSFSGKVNDDLSQLLIDGSFAGVLSTDVIINLYPRVVSPSWHEEFTNNIKQFLSEKLSDRDQLNTVLSAGVAALQLFVQNNWVGPPISTSNIPEIGKDTATELLEIDAEGLYPLSRDLKLLCIAYVIFIQCRDNLLQLQAYDIWLLNYIKVHQALLSERSQTLKSLLLQTTAKVRSWLDDACVSQSLRLSYHIKVAHLLYYFYEPALAEHHLTTALDTGHVTIELTGQLGKRTRYQEHDKAQLVLRVQLRGEEGHEQAQLRGEEREEQEGPDTLLPTDVALNDDTVLNKIQFTEGDGNWLQNIEKMSALDQALVLAKVFHHRRSHEGQGDIVREESLTFINCVLETPRSWSIQSAALLMRSQWEKGSSRRVERSLAQLEELVNQFKREVPPGDYRLRYVYIVDLPPLWVIEKSLADLLCEMGARKSALDVYLRLEMWEQVIECYKELGSTGLAEKLIRSRLLLKATPLLYIHLGDVTNDPRHYEHAWELSNHRNARAQRALAFYWLRKQEFEKCLPHFRLSLSVNPLQLSSWFSYGCASLACQHFDDAITAFKRCVTMEQDNFEAWANLAAAYIKKSAKDKAFTALQEALRCEYEKWQLWENYMLVGLDVGAFSEVIRSYHRLLDLKDKYTDSQVLTILVQLVIDNQKDGSGQDLDALRPKLRELFGRITSKVNDAAIWRQYGRLVILSDEVTEDDILAGIGHLQKSLRNLLLIKDWQNTVEQCSLVLQVSLELLEAYTHLLDSSPSQVNAIRSSRLILQPVLTKTKRKDLIDQFNPTTEELESLDNVVSLSDKLRLAHQELQERLQSAPPSS